MATQKLWSCVVLLLSLGLAGPVRAGGVENDSIQWYDDQVYENLQQRDARYTEWSKCGYPGLRCPDGSPGYYGFAEVTDGIAAAYQANGREYYLQRLIAYARGIMSAGKDNNGDGYLDYFHWMHDRKRAENYDKWDYEPGYNYGAYCYWNMMRTVTHCARVGRLGPHYEKYKDDIDEIVAFIEKQVIEKWEKGDQGMTLAQYLQQDCYGVDAYSHIGADLVDAYLATGNPHYKDLATRFAEKITNPWVLYSIGSYAWSGDGGVQIPKDCRDVSFEFGSKRYGVQDTAHSIRVIRFAAIAHRAGVVVTEEDMGHLVNTFDKNLWRSEDEKFADYVNGADDPKGRWTFSCITQWVRVGGFDKATHQRLVEWTGGPRRPDKYHEDRIHYFGILALNLKLQKDGYKLHPYQQGGQ